ncbi:MAG: hypothetical protein KC777_17950 [Cyanobacteria bacterium HKST-UBA02]|nr:hypothetical protein [Cyanobacteria bacterium HKST-UBA02]
MSQDETAENLLQADNTTDILGDSVSIRMYNVGFGDAFLVRFPTQEGVKSILIDCGVHFAGKSMNDIEDIVKDIIDTVTIDEQPIIDIVVCTHRHQDHVSGFASKAWDAVEVGEIWMPWTENPLDSNAKAINSAQSRAAIHLARMVEGDLVKYQNGSEESQHLHWIRKLAFNALSNEKAMRSLHHGFKGAPVRKFLPYLEDERRSFSVTQIPGLIVHVLGPSRDPKVIKHLNPPVIQSYLKLVDEAGSWKDNPIVPFPDGWIIDEEDLATACDEFVLDDRTKSYLEAFDSDYSKIVAASLDKAINGTSLVLIFEFGGALLLFSGDAQWGTWNAALEDEEWRELLSRISFYKVGHHGSHNATPVSFVEEVLNTDGRQCFAMVSTMEMKPWPNIPRLPLLSALADKSVSIARSDQPEQVSAEDFNTNGSLYIECNVPF